MVLWIYDRKRYSWKSTSGSEIEKRAFFTFVSDLFLDFWEKFLKHARIDKVLIYNSISVSYGREIYMCIFLKKKFEKLLELFGLFFGDVYSILLESFDHTVFLTLLFLR